VCDDAEHILFLASEAYALSEHVTEAVAAGRPWVVMVIPDIVRAVRTADGELVWRWEVHLLEVAGADVTIDRRSIDVTERNGSGQERIVGQCQERLAISLPAYGHVVDIWEWRKGKGGACICYYWYSHDEVDRDSGAGSPVESSISAAGFPIRLWE